MTTRRTHQTSPLFGGVDCLAPLLLAVALLLAAPVLAGGKGGKGGGGGGGGKVSSSSSSGGKSGSSGHTSSRASSSDNGGSKSGSGGGGGSHGNRGGGGAGGWGTGGGGSAPVTAYDPPKPSGHTPKASGHGSGGGSGGGWSSGWQPSAPRATDLGAPKPSAPRTSGSPSHWGGSPSGGQKGPDPSPSGGFSSPAPKWGTGGGGWQAPSDPGGKGSGGWQRPSPGGKDVTPPRVPPKTGPITPRPPSDKSPVPPGSHGGRGDPGGGFYPGRGGGHDSWRPPKTGRVSYRAWDDHRPPCPIYWNPRYRHYYYRTLPGVYIYGGWGAGWYDPWWWGNYWWPECRTTEVHHYYHYGYDDPGQYMPPEEGAPWIDAELQTAMVDVAVAWSTGDVKLLQAHLTPEAPVAVRHDWERDEQWVLAPPVFLDMVVEALDAQTESRFRFVQAEEMEPGLVWAVAEHTFRLRDDDRERSTTMEYMFRRNEGTWLVEAILASPANYWWADPEVLDDAARESARLFEELDRARVSEAE